MNVTKSHHIVLIKFSHLNRTTSTFALKLSPLQVAKFDFVHYINLCSLENFKIKILDNLLVEKWPLMNMKLLSVTSITVGMPENNGAEAHCF
jgi:hypothetical protein